MNIKETYEKNGYNITVFYDECPESPRTWDVLGKFYCNNRNYTCDKLDMYDLAELLEVDIFALNIKQICERADRKGYLCYPISCYIHGGIALHFNSTDYDRFDGGIFGFYLSEKKDICNRFSKKIVSKSLRKEVEGYIENEIKAYEDYCNGNVYGYNITNKFGEEIDSCYGFYGDLGIEDMKSQIDDMINSDEKQQVLLAIEMYAD